jgi:hypothetical protein
MHRSPAGERSVGVQLQPGAACALLGLPADELEHAAGLSGAPAPTKRRGTHSRRRRSLRSWSPSRDLLVSATLRFNDSSGHCAGLVANSAAARFPVGAFDLVDASSYSRASLPRDAAGLP